MSEDWNPAIARKARRKIAEHFEVHSITQDRFASMLGVHPNTIHMWEVGKRAPEVHARFVFFKIIEDPSFIEEVRRLVGDEQTTGG
jgi:DNA-binding XRE family transcriptional regulator